MSSTSAFSLSSVTLTALQPSSFVGRLCTRRPRAHFVRVSACVPSGAGAERKAAAEASERPLEAAESASNTASDETLYAEPDVGEMGYGSSKSINIYEGAQDDIDRSNTTFGQYNKLSERDLLYGNYVRVEDAGKEGAIRMFYREVLPVGDFDATQVVLLIPGLPASSYSFREVLPQIAKAGYRAISPDLPGFGFSDKPAPRYEFEYDSESYIEALRRFLDAVGVKHVKCVVAQGWLATNALRLAIRDTELVDSAFVLNAPLPPVRPRLPFAMGRWALPAALGSAFAQDALSIEKTIEGGSYYALDVKDAEVYRRPSMLSGDTGFSLAAAAGRLDMATAFEELEQLKEYKKPIEVAWGVDDKYLKKEVGERFVADVCPQASFVELQGAGHFGQEDFGERVADAVVAFLRKHSVDE